jgi:hypothetical protein
LRRLCARADQALYAPELDRTFQGVWNTGPGSFAPEI